MIQVLWIYDSLNQNSIKYGIKMSRLRAAFENKKKLILWSAIWFLRNAIDFFLKLLTRAELTHK